MKLVFTRGEDGNSLTLKTSSTEEMFDYINMLKCFIDGERLEESEFSGEFSEEEKEIVSEMIERINNAVDKKPESNEDVVVNSFDTQGTTIRVEDIPF